MTVKIEDIARICHEANRHYCEVSNMPQILPWSSAPDWQKQSAIAGVEAIIDNPDTTSEESHANWTQHKIAAGWSYGRDKNPVAKTHPCLVPYNELPEAQRLKDTLFVNIVRALMPPPETFNRAYVTQSLGHEMLRGAMTDDEVAHAQAVMDANPGFDPSAPIIVDPSKIIPPPTEQKEASHVEENAQEQPEDQPAQAAGDGQQAGRGQG